ncbi:MAG TPA: protein kinase [Vicinamibacterales bacterium]|nr:protein kinase [Vicinamibacterales bacterium]
MMRESIGRYSITGLLGEGGMGVVYSAHDSQLGRQVAIKMIRATVNTDTARERLYREARSAASINHPSICQLYEIGEDGGELFLAMELLQGESLATRLTRGPMSLSEAVSTTLGILHGMEALQRQSLVHRDLKPSNIFLTPHGVKLLDFGLATTAHDRLAEATITRLTQPGTVVGTPQYAAPEQLQGGVVDARTDIFAAGAILYEMLAGKPPFSGSAPVEIFHSILYDQPPVLTGGPSVAALDRVVHRALSKQAQDRYQSADAMAQDLRAALSLGDTGSGASARALTRLIVLPFRILRADPETDFLAFSLADAITSSLSGLQSLVVRSSVAAGKFGEGHTDLKMIATETDVDVVLLGTLLRAGSQLRVTTQLVDASGAAVLWSHTAQAPVGDLFSLQDDLASRIVESLSLPLTARERRMLKQDVPSSAAAYELFLRGNELSRESAQWRAALELYERCITEDPHYAPGWAGAGRMHRMIAKYEGTETDERLARAEQALKRALELNPDHSAAENVLAHLEVDLGRAEASMVRLLRRAKDRPADPDLYAGLTHACRYCGLVSASIAATEQARRLDPKIRTSGAHSYFMIGEYERVVDFQPERVPFMRCLALVMLGQEAQALEELAALDAGNGERLGMFVNALRRDVEGRHDEAMALMRILADIPDPEGGFYVARGMAHVGYPEEALRLLGKCVDDGFFCLTAYARDPWLDSLRGDSAFSALLRRAEARHRQAMISFLNAEGDRILGVSHPV